MTVFAATAKCCGENVKSFDQVSFYTRSGCPMDLLIWRELIMTVYTITHNNDLEELFPGNELLEWSD